MRSVNPLARRVDEPGVSSWRSDESGCRERETQAERRTAMAVPTLDVALKNWSLTFLAGITPSPTSLGLVVGQVTTFDGLLDLYIADLAAWENDPGRSKNLTVAKHLSKGNLL